MAVTLVDAKAHLRLDADNDDAGLQRHVDAATALVEAYAPSAPNAIKDEATLRATAYMYEDRGDLYADAEVARVPRSGVLRLSGAKAVLSPWRKQRALVV